MSERCPGIEHVPSMRVILRCILPAGHDGDHLASELEPDGSDE